TETMKNLELPLAGLVNLPSVAVFTARLFPDMVPKLGLLGPTTIENVIAAYNAVENRHWELLKDGAELHSSSNFPSIKEFRVSPDLDAATMRALVMQLNQAAMIAITRTITELDRPAEPSRLRRAWRWMRATG